MRILLKPAVVLLLSLFVFVNSVGAQSLQADGATLAKAIALAEADDWAGAESAARKIKDPVGADIILWRKLRASKGTWGEYQSFLKRNPDWPGLKLLRKRGEEIIPKKGSPAPIIAYFKDQLPQTGTGSLRLAEALIASGNKAAAEAEAVRAWTTFTLTKAEAVSLLNAYPKPLSNNHWTRMDMLLWSGALERANGMLSVVTKEQARLAAARIGLRKRVDGVDALINAVPARLKDHPGLAYERFLWRARKGLGAGARSLILERSTSAKALGNPGAWADRRRTMARAAMRSGNPKTAYNLASNHHLTSGSDYADLEWLSGYLALRKLNKPGVAVTHFKNHRNAVETPISYGRAGYWIGRAYEAMGDEAQAREAYGFGAKYQTSFYGQLAAERGGFPADQAVAGAEKYPDWRNASFVGSTPYRAIFLAHYAGEDYLAERFFVQLSETQDRAGLGQLLDLAMHLNHPEIAVRTAKYATRFSGITVEKHYFPVTDLAKLDVNVKNEHALSIARRESEFDVDIISPVGARGLMQVMPKTAQSMAGKLGLKYSSNRMLTDWKYNAAIGSKYLGNLFDEYNGSWILAFAAYNAGPSRAERWMRNYGDPRRSNVDAIDWIEHIPYRETRNYVMRVTESVYVYKARLAGKAPKLTISKDLKRGG